MTESDLIKRAEALLLPGFDHRPVVANLLAGRDQLRAEVEELRTALATVSEENNELRSILDRKAGGRP